MRKITNKMVETKNDIIALIAQERFHTARNMMRDVEKKWRKAGYGYKWDELAQRLMAAEEK